MQAVPIQLTQVKEPPLDEKLHEKFHYHTRNEFVKLKWNEPSGDIQVKDLFKKATEYAYDFKNGEFNIIQSNIVGIIGQPGVGKTTLTKEILRQIVYNDLFEAKYVFFLKLRDCSYDEKTDLLTFLTSNSIPLQFGDIENRRRLVLDELDKNNDVVIILDGFDEATIKNIKKNSNQYRCELPEVFIRGLLRGNILPNSKKLITSRPKQFYDLSSEFRPNFVVSLTGIDREAQRQLCQYICEAKSDEVFQSVCDQPDLISYCFVPVLCTLLMHCMKILQFTPGCNIPKTISNVFVWVLSLFLNGTSHCSSKETDVEGIPKDYLKHLGKLAWELFRENKYYFELKRLETVGFRKSERLGFVDTTLVFTGKQAFMLGGSPKKMMYFTHLLWEELLVAMYFLFFTSPKEFEQQHLSGEINLKEGRMEMVTKFLFGLCNDESVKTLNDNFLLHFPSQHIEMLKKWALNQLENFDENNKSNLFKCLPILGWAHELNDQEFSCAIAGSMIDDLTINGLIHPIDISVLESLFNARKHLLDKQKGFNVFVINNAEFAGDSLKRFLKILEIACYDGIVEKVNN